MTLLIVTPMHNEADNISDLVATLRAQRFQDFDWVAVDDGCTDGFTLQVSSPSPAPRVTPPTTERT